MQDTLIDRLLAGVRINPAAPAMISKDRILTHHQALSLVGATARRLHEAGLRPGQVVGILMEHAPLHCIAVLALARLGVVSVPIPATMAPETRGRLMRGYAIDTLVSSWTGAPDLPFRVITLEKITAKPADADLDFIEFRPVPETPMRVVLSSGTTKDPRGVLHTHGDWVRRMDRTVIGCDSTSRLLPPDLHITLAMVFTHGVLCAGGCVVFPQSNERDHMLHAINQCAVTHLIISPAGMAAVVPVLPNQGLLLPSLKQLRLVGTAPAPALIDKLRNSCTPNLCVPYGLTELGPISMASAETLVQHPDSAGHVYPWARVEIVDVAGQPVPPGTSGEIRVAVDAMPQKYYRPDDDADGKFRNGWFHPGDRGHLSAEGLLFIEGRIDDILNIGGYKASPENVEATLGEHPSVAEAAVYMEPVAGGGAVLAAAIVQAPGACFEGFGAFTRSRLGIMTPQRYHLVTSLPRNAMGKLQRDRLVEMAEVALGEINP